MSKVSAELLEDGVAEAMYETWCELKGEEVKQFPNAVGEETVALWRALASSAIVAIEYDHRIVPA